MKYSEWSEEKKEKARAAHRRWNERNKVKRKEYYTAYDAARTPAKNIHKAMKARQKDSDVRVEDIIVPNNCPICFKEMRPSKKRGGDILSPTLDKIIPEKGYVKGNIAVICKLCNSQKGNASSEKHRRIADWIDTFL